MTLNSQYDAQIQRKYPLIAFMVANFIEQNSASKPGDFFIVWICHS